MQVVVADTTSLRYLAEIGQIDLLFRLFDQIFIPEVVLSELLNSDSPQVFTTAVNPTCGWLEIVSFKSPNTDPALIGLDEGERVAITLSLSLGADFLLIDERKRAMAARMKG